MSIVNKIFKIIMVLVMIVGAIASNDSVFADGDRDSSNYEVVITKMKMDSLEGWPKKYENGISKDGYTGGKINDIKNFFGNGSTPMEGVYFEVHEKDEKGKIVFEGRTESDGTLKVKDLKKGKYVIVENKKKSKYKSDENKEIGESKAVPMLINLPVYKENGEIYTVGENALHVYPKSTVSKPSIAKYVSEKYIKDTAFIGEKKTFSIVSKMPAGIKDYNLLKFVDEMDSGLTYDGEIQVQVNEKNIDGNKFNLNTHKNEDNKTLLELKFSKEEIKELNEGDVIKIMYKSHINSYAKMGVANKNEVKVIYTTNSSDEGLKENKSIENPEIYTGGIKFKKVDSLEKKTLGGAKFIVLNQEKKYLKKDGNSSIVWTKDKEEATKFESGNDDGIFEIKGLAYGKNTGEEETSYYLREVEAPKGYAKLIEDYEFKINKNSYYSDINSLIEKNPTLIKNNKISIPQTGGSGSRYIVCTGFLITVLGTFVKKKYLN